MSFYTRNKFNLTDHGIERAKQRLKLPKDMLEAKITLNKMLENIDHHEFDDAKYYYYKVPNYYGLYFIVSKIDMTLVTVSKISDHKKLYLLSKDEKWRTKKN